MARKIHDRATGFKRYLTATEWVEYVRAGRRRTYEKADFVLRQWDPNDTVHLLTEGRVKVEYTEPGGGEVLLSVRGPGDLLGELARSMGRRMASVRAIEPCVTYELSGRVFIELVKRHGRQREFEKYTMSKLAQSAPHQWCAARMRTKARLAQLLILVVEAAGPTHASPMRVNLSQEEIAGALGVVRSAVTPILKVWKAQGVIKVVRGGVVVQDPEMLRGLVDAQCDP